MRIRALAIAATLVVALAGCGSGESATPTAEETASTEVRSTNGPDLTGVEFTDLTGSEAVDVQARDNVFVEEFIEVSPGTTVTFTNRGQQGHDVLPADEGAFTPIEPDSFEPGDVGEITFDEPGDYSYYCSLHGTAKKGMTGTVRVIA